MFVPYLRKNSFIFSYFIILTLVIVLSTTYIWSVFYWNDEWRAVADVYAVGVNAISYRGQLVSFVPNQIGELLIQGRFIGALIFNRLIHIAPFQPIRLISIILVSHLLNSFLIFIILKRFTKNSIFSVTTSLFFALSSIHVENFIWLGAGYYNILSMTFALLTLLFLQTFMSKRNMLYIISACITALVAYEWKENCAFLFLFIPAFVILFLRKHILRKGLWATGIFVILVFLLGTLAYSHQSQIANIPEGFGYANIAKIAFNLMYYPVSNFSQFLVPYSVIMAIRTGFSTLPEAYFFPITRLAGINSNLFLFDCVSIIFAFLICIVLIKVYRLYPNFRKILLIGLFWYVFSMGPLAVRLVTRFNGYLTYSYLYHPLFSVSVFFSCFAVFFNDMIKKRISVPIIPLLVVCYFLLQIFVGNKNSQSTIRFYRSSQAFISQFQSLKLNIPEKPIIFIHTSVEYSLNSITARLPFMLGSGFIMSILAYPSGVIPSEFLVNRYLEPFDSQGYKEIHTKGYGFFWNMDNLKQEFRNRPDLSVHQIIGLDYSDSVPNVTDISDAVRKEIQNDRMEKVRYYFR